MVADMIQKQLIAALTEGLADFEPLRGLFLSGSFGYGAADAYSDVDFVALLASGEEDGFLRLWRDRLGAFEPIVFWNERRGGGLLVNAITSSWLRCDLYVTDMADFQKRTRDSLSPLIDRDGIYPTLPEGSPRSELDANRVRWLISEFIRVFGLLGVAMNRKEYANAITGIFHLRNQFIALLIEESDISNKGGALHLNRLLSDEQMAVLLSLPGIEPERQSVIDAHLAYADAFLPRARALASRAGVEWPEAFEAATWLFLQRELGIDKNGRRG
jgi:hypothetical protein